MSLFTPLSTTSSKRFAALIYGSTKVGKSTLAGGSLFVPEMRDVLILDSERSSDAVSHFEADGSTLFMEPITGMEDLINVATAFRKKAKGTENIKTVIIDTISTIRDNFLDEQALGTQRAGSKMQGRTEISDFMKVTTLLRNTVDVFMQVPDLNIFVLAHEQDIDGLTYPYMNQALRGGIVARMSSIWYMHLDRNGNRLLEVLPNKRNSYVQGLGTRNTVLRNNLAVYTREHTPEGDNPEKWEGTLIVPDDNSMMKTLYGLYGD